MNGQTASAFRQFSRNERWGTCVDCPRGDGHVWPEFCEHTDRYDHHLDLDDLLRTYCWSKDHGDQ